jgi:HEAT repeat protein
MTDHETAVLHGEHAVSVALRRRDAARAGHLGDEAGARAALHDAEATVRATGLGALLRMGHATEVDAAALMSDPASAARRYAAELAPRFPAAGVASKAATVAMVVRLLGDESPEVIEVACYALGELEDPSVTDALAEIALRHDDVLCRESAVAALGAIGDPAGLAAILESFGDKATVRRRAVIALAAFDGPEVDAAMSAALEDRDWQVRQAAEDLTGVRGESE